MSRGLKIATKEGRMLPGGGKPRHPRLKVKRKSKPSMKRCRLCEGKKLVSACEVGASAYDADVTCPDCFGKGVVKQYPIIPREVRHVWAWKEKDIYVCLHCRIWTARGRTIEVCPKRDRRVSKKERRKSKTAAKRRSCFDKNGVLTW